ncbi:MAG: hypothetical protein RI934_1287 [Bacteroidota bacterium]|jgi:uncharacterized protein involved in exopolysaccharide biosynthesis
MQTPEIQNDEISIKELIQKVAEWFVYFKSQWKIIFFAGILGGLLGLGYSYIKKPIYTAKLSFALEEKGATGGGLSSIAAQFGLGGIGGGDGGVFSGGNMIELLKSRFLIEKTLLSTVSINSKSDLLINRYVQFNKLEQMWAKKVNLAGLKFTNADRNTFTLQQDSVLGEISNGLIKNNVAIAQQDKKLSIININVTSADEIFAKVFSEKLIETVTDFYIETKTKKSRGNVQLLQNRADSVQRELNAAMYGRALLGDQNMGLIRQQAAVPKLKQEMKVQMLGTLYGELVKNLEFAKLTLMREEPLVQIIDQPILPLPKERLGKLKAMILGGMLFGFLSLLTLSGKKVWKGMIK